ncbi:hypothetical protein PPYR_07524 [Photinus pyralis]|uniref:Lipase n=1 Tax=Photinus pyralis TaxID=7054 RepID=A0A1Y1MRZ1_PHOPY|nr:lipase 3-like [Photinus pyralis]KAB0799644.1 hypothetical protein PPYR_07524 [Photinus pyralis]
MSPSAMLFKGLIIILATVSFSRQEEVRYGDLVTNFVVPEDAKLLVPELIRKYGYPCEVHTVVSKDGYVLEMHRIPFGKSGPSENRPAVYLQHGILASSADWVLKQDTGLGYVLADAGYDVWMPNVRGTRYSRKHITLDPDNDASKFWDFSWHEIAVDDVPTMVDYVIDTVKQEQIFYIGHSQGTTIFYVMCSELPEYNGKIRAMFSFSPVAWMGHMTSPLLRIVAMANWFVGPFLNLIGVHELLPQHSFFAEIGDKLCGDNSFLQPLCTNALFAICGFNPKQMNASLIPTIMGHTPAGAATKQLLHFAQEVNSGHFRKYDYGFFRNIAKYGSISPPKYKLKKVTAPVYLHYSRNDWISNEKDVIKLSRELGNVKGKFLILDDRFNHVDFVYGIDAYQLLYLRVLGLMKRH